MASLASVPIIVHRLRCLHRRPSLRQVRSRDSRVVLISIWTDQSASPSDRQTTEEDATVIVDTGTDAEQDGTDPVPGALEMDVEEDEGGLCVRPARKRRGKVRGGNDK